MKTTLKTKSAPLPRGTALVAAAMAAALLSLASCRGPETVPDPEKPNPEQHPPDSPHGTPPSPQGNTPGSPLNPAAK